MVLKTAQMNSFRILLGRTNVGSLTECMYLSQFDYQVQTFIREFLLSNCAPLGQIENWSYRVEFQHDSPHIHMLTWIKDAPRFGVNSEAHVIATCPKPPDDNTRTTMTIHSCSRKFLFYSFLIHF